MRDSIFHVSFLSADDALSERHSAGIARRHLQGAGVRGIRTLRPGRGGIRTGAATEAQSRYAQSGQAQKATEATAAQEINAAKRKAEDKRKSALLGAEGCRSWLEERFHWTQQRYIQKPCEACGTTIPADVAEVKYARFFCCQAVTVNGVEKRFLSNA